MNIHRLILFPNGDVHRQHWARLPAATDGLVKQVDARFDGLHCDAAIPIRPGLLRVDWKGSELGGAIGSFYLDDQLFLCTMLACGLNAKEDEIYLKTTGEAWDRSEMVRGFVAGEPSGFATVHEITDRPLLVGMLIPTLPGELYDQIDGVELAVVSAYLSRVTPKTRKRIR